MEQEVILQHAAALVPQFDVRAARHVLRAAAAAIREAIPAAEGEDDLKLSTVAGMVHITVEVPKPEKVKAEKPAKKAKAAAKKTPAKKAKPAAEPEAEAEPKAKAKKPAAKKAKPVAAEDDDDLGIPGASAVGEDDEPAKLPPKVASDEEVPDDEVDI